MSKSILEWLDTVVAEFDPIRRDDLSEGAKEWIGRTTVWQANHIIEQGDYAGEWAMNAVGRECAPFTWVPMRDLKVADVPINAVRPLQMP